MRTADHPAAREERRRIARLLDHWAVCVPIKWPGVEDSHAALLRHLSTVFALPPEEPNEDHSGGSADNRPR